MIRSILLTAVVALAFLPSYSQTLGEYFGEEASLYAQTKQVNQFFRRFNGEENASGLRYKDGESGYRDEAVRRRYLQMIFDLENPHIEKDQRKTFIENVTDAGHPVFLNFHNGEWFAEVTTQFLYFGAPGKATLFLKLEEENEGYKWVITHVFFKPFHDLFSREDDGKMRFLHPLSHELDFMNLIRVFREKETVAQYTAREFKPDYLSVFLYELKRGNLIFQNVLSVKFHFFQVPGWYFELAEINRKGPNSGWLITGLVEITETEKEVLLKYIYYE